MVEVIFKSQEMKVTAAVKPQGIVAWPILTLYDHSLTTMAPAVDDATRAGTFNETLERWCAAGPLLDGLPNSIVLHLNDAARHQDTGSLVQLWMSEASRQAPGCDAAIDRLAYVVFIHVLREQLARGHIKGPLEALSDARLGPVLNLIHANPGAIESVDAMANMASMSRSAFADRLGPDHTVRLSRSWSR